MQPGWVNKMNVLGEKRVPFVFIIDFDMKESKILSVSEIDPEILLYDINGNNNFGSRLKINKKIVFEKFPVSFKEYKKAFDIVKKNLEYGNSYLLNLTFPTPVKTNYTPKEIFYTSHAKYRIWYQDRFVVFSPEIFVQIKNNKIYSFPMKGTIDANLPGAFDKIIQNPKELAEHNTIVDLIRNDLSRIAKRVRVDRFRFIDTIKSTDKDLLQVSSQISGELNIDFHAHLGDILFKLLPAGSISGAPKKKTVEIIQEVENYKRGYYTGICGYYDGQDLDSGVMIRFIENDKGELIYKSGGGITVNSDPEYEYNELIDKVYVPVI